MDSSTLYLIVLYAIAACTDLAGIKSLTRHRQCVPTRRFCTGLVTTATLSAMIGYLVGLRLYALLPVWPDSHTALVCACAITGAWVIIQTVADGLTTPRRSSSAVTLDDAMWIGVCTGLAELTCGMLAGFVGAPWLFLCTIVLAVSGTYLVLQRHPLPVSKRLVKRMGWPSNTHLFVLLAGVVLVSASVWSS